MKTEFIRGVGVVRVEGPGAWNNCTIKSADGKQRLECAFISSICFTNDRRPPCEDKPVIFIRPDQIIDYIAIKLVS